MPDPNFILLFVDSPEASADFYQTILDKKPVELSRTFALFALSSGVMLGLWSRHTAEPAPTAAGGGAELAFAVADIAAVDALHAEWSRRGLIIAQPPTALDFGHTFVALDPDGHRLRVFAPTGG